MASENFDADILVIGGGLAGARAAARLHAGGASVILLEARDRLGGRTHTRPLGGTMFDVGGQWIGPGQPRMYELTRQLGLELSPTYVTGRKVLELNGRRRSYGGTLPFRSPFKLIPLHLLMRGCNRLARGVPADAPQSAQRAYELDEMTLKDAQRRSRLLGKDVRHLANSVVRVMFGAEPHEVTMLHFLWYVSSNGGLRPLVETKGGFQQDRIVGGTQQIAERVAAVLGGERILLDTEVRSIAQDASGVTVRSSAASWRARRVVVAVPLAIAGRIAYEPDLPVARTAIHQRVSMGSTIKVLATYERAFWRERGYSGEAVGTSGAISVAFDNTTPDGSVPCLVGFIAGAPARQFAATPRDRRRAQVLAEFTRFYGPEAGNPVQYEEMDWGEERYSGGCPIANYAPGALAGFGAALRAPAGRIHWAGTESARVCTGYMEGALESGDRAADEALAGL